MGIVEVGIGFMMLLAGRPTYWVYVGGITFLIGSQYARQRIIFSWSWDNLLLALVFAVVGVALTFSFNRWAARIASFLAGGYLIYTMPTLFTGKADNFSPLYFALAGIAAVILVLISFNVGIVVLSALVGATMILNNIQIGMLDQRVMFGMLSIISIITQYLLMLFIEPSPD